MSQHNTAFKVFSLRSVIPGFVLAIITIGVKAHLLTSYSFHLSQKVASIPF